MCSPVVVLTLLALAGRTVIVTRLYLLLLQVCFKASEVCVQPPDVLIHLQGHQGQGLPRDRAQEGRGRTNRGQRGRGLALKSRGARVGMA